MPYLPRRPQETVLYGLVKEHWQDFVHHAREAYEAPLPKYVVEEFRRYLACGDFSAGFIMATCGSCGHALLVAFSCKLRGVCPSCAGRRMAEAAAHLVDRVIPSAPLRQYVLSFPYELSGLAAVHPEVLTNLSRLFWAALSRRYRTWAKQGGLARPEMGAVTGVQRFGSSLNVHVHFHLLMADGVYLEDGESVRFVAAPAPTRSELTALASDVHRRVMRWLTRRGFMKDREASNERPSLSPDEALVLLGTQRGSLATLRTGDANEDQDEGASGSRAPSCSSPDAVTVERFNLHAGVTIRADDDVGRERLCRYLTRPAFALERIVVQKDGNVRYRVKKVSRHRTTYRVMTPLEFLGRIAALIPPPRYPLLRFHGVFAPRHALRDRIVPRPPSRARTSAACRAMPPGLEPLPVKPRRKPERECPGDGRAAFVMPEPVRVQPTEGLVASGAAEQASPNILSLAHWDRLRNGELYAPLGRIEWAVLLRRTFDVDVRACVHCGGRLSIRAVVTDATTIEAVLASLRSARAPPIAATAS